MNELNNNTEVDEDNGSDTSWKGIVESQEEAEEQEEHDDKDESDDTDPAFDDEDVDAVEGEEYVDEEGGVVYKVKF